MANKAAMAPSQVATRRGRVENDVMPSNANRSILLSGYLVVPAKRWCRS